jgi:hypothetical protein
MWHALGCQFEIIKQKLKGLNLVHNLWKKNEKNPSNSKCRVVKGEVMSKDVGE